jgi:hypothetical protein
MRCLWHTDYCTSRVHIKKLFFQEEKKWMHGQQLYNEGWSTYLELMLHQMNMRSIKKIEMKRQESKQIMELLTVVIVVNRLCLFIQRHRLPWLSLIFIIPFEKQRLEMNYFYFL